MFSSFLYMLSVLAMCAEMSGIYLFLILTVIESIFSVNLSVVFTV